MTETISALAVIFVCSVHLVYWVTQTFRLLFGPMKRWTRLGGIQTEVTSGPGPRISACGSWADPPVGARLGRCG
jgi:hypothetical protein